MTISKFFEKLGAKLKNIVWSWGAVRGDGSVVLRVWQHRTKKIDGVSYVQLTHLEKYGDGRGADNLGYSERLDHVGRIRNGAKCYMVMCRVRDPDASPAEIQSFNKESVFIGGRLLDVDGDTWKELASRVPAKSVI